MSNIIDADGIKINGKQVVDKDGALYQGGVKFYSTGAEIDRACDLSERKVSVTTATFSATASHDGKLIVLDKADGIAVTLPAATGTGIKLKMHILTTITSNATTIKVTGNDVMYGNAVMANDSDASASIFETASDSDTISFNGSTTGGIKGTTIELTDIATDTWFVNIQGSATGSEATPFSATVT